MTEAAVTKAKAGSSDAGAADAEPADGGTVEDAADGNTASGNAAGGAGEEFVIELLDRAVSGMGGQSRDGQHEMARQVARAIDSGDHLLVQAGTGTGKSLAYLIPLIAHSLTSNKPTLVSTATLALQTQIVGRDLPRLLKTITPALERPVKVALVKGRSNYVCRHKIEGGFPSEEPSEGQLFSLGEDTSVPHFAAALGGPSSQLGKEVVRLREWAEETATGDRDELMPGVTDRAWRQVSVTSMECLGAQKCPLAAECFSELARQNAADADVVVTNHAMLAVSAFEGLAVLPEYDVVVVDEAHELQDRVTGAVSGQLSVAMVHAAASGARKHTGLPPGARHRRRPQRVDAERPEHRATRLHRPVARRLPRRAVRFQGGQFHDGRRRSPARPVPPHGHPGTLRTPPGRAGKPRSRVVLPQ
jgi:ATP-dependent DNA helicase DinG